MTEENKNVSKNGWKRIFGKKWFFPAVYLTVAALLLTGVLWYQNLDNQVPEATEDTETDISDEDLIGGNQPTDEFDQDSQPVMDQQEVVKMPVAEEVQTEIVTKFYDYEADSEDQEKALVQYDNSYYQSDGLDLVSSDGETFDVTASLSGTVTDVKETPLLGEVVEITHENGLTTHYAALADILVENGAEVEQGDVIASAGQNALGQANGIHVHFQLRKDGEPVNPESYFNEPTSEVQAPADDEEAPEEDESSSEEDGTEEDSIEEDVIEEDSLIGDDEADEGADEEEDTEEDTEDEDADADEDADNAGSTESSASMANA
ncbi:M23 family metallopeptidase [Aquibacillus sediminis]|uniref:M23 family metallopeptidase n=1 Tax=Aquibacillus sediminis TaxID=2574734 RepID=UPI001107D537|nr:M23 family metallopeptidase [Aquibacillus sediminis]